MPGLYYFRLRSTRFCVLLSASRKNVATALESGTLLATNSIGALIVVVMENAVRERSPVVLLAEPGGRPIVFHRVGLISLKMKGAR